jgi:O-antigen/teichoic acid export membrane protein
MDSNGSTSPGDRFSSRLTAYASTSVVLHFFRLAYAFSKPKFLSPADLGLWNLLALIPQYASYLHLGSRVGILYRIPRLLGEGGQEELIENIKISVYWYTLGVNAVLSILLMSVAILISWEPVVRYGILATSIYVMVNWYYDFQLAILKAYQKFHIIVHANIINAFTLVLICIPLVAVLKIYGVFIGAILSSLLSAIYMGRKNPVQIGWCFDRGLLWDMICQGFPLMVYNLGFVLLTTADRLIIGTMLDREAVGYYAVAVVLTGFMLQIPMAARDMLEPQLMMKMVGEERDLVWRDFFSKPLVSTAVLFPLMWGPTAFLSEDALRIMLPSYVNSVESVIVLAHGVFFLALLQVIRGKVVAQELQVRVLFPLSLGLALNVAMSYVFIKHGTGIYGVALASGLSFSLVFFLVFIMILKRSPFGFQEGSRLMAAVLAPLAYSLVAIVLLNRVFETIDLRHELLALIKLVIYLIGAAILIIVVEQKLGGYSGPLRKLLVFLQRQANR